MPRKRQQHTERRYMEFRDQHNRRYSTWIENLTGHPCSPYIPLFSAPVMPPAAAMEIDPNAPRRVRINYRKWLSDAQATWRERAKSVVKLAQKHGHSTASVLENPTPDILARIGQPPTALQLIVACAQGNRWALGLDPRSDVRLVKFLPIEAQDVDIDVSSFDFGTLVTEGGGEVDAAADAYALPGIGGEKEFDGIHAVGEIRLGDLLDEELPDLADGAEPDDLSGADDLSDPLALEPEGENEGNGEEDFTPKRTKVRGRR